MLVGAAGEHSTAMLRHIEFIYFFTEKVRPQSCSLRHLPMPAYKGGFGGLVRTTILQGIFIFCLLGPKAWCRLSPHSGPQAGARLDERAR